MRSIRVFRNAATNYVRLGVGVLIGLFLTPFLVHQLGDAPYGLWVAVFALTGYFGLFDQGIRPSMVRYVSRFHAQGDGEALSRSISSAFVLYAGVGVLALAATVLIAARFGAWFRVEPAMLPVARLVVAVSGLSLAIGFPLGVFGATLSGLQRYDVANAIGVGVSVIRAAGFVAVLHLGFGLPGLAWCALATNLLGHALSWIAVRRLLPGLRISPRAVSLEHLGLLGSYSGFAFVGALASLLTFQTDALVITAFLGAALVTPFALAAALVETARSLVHAATWVLSPTASELETRGEDDALRAMMIAGSKYSVLLSWPLLIAFLVFGENLLTTWVGERYASAAGLLAILTWPTLIALPQSAASSVLFGVSRHRGVVGLFILNAVLNLGLSLLWVRPFGLAGVAMGTAVPLALVGGAATILYTCRALRLPLGAYLWEGMMRPGLVTLVFAALALLAQAAWRPVGWIPLLGTCAACWAGFALCAWPLALSGDERRRWGRVVPAAIGLMPAAAGSGGQP